MAAADQSAARVDDDVTAVVAPAGGDERPGLPLGAEAQLLVGDQLGDGEAVVDLGDVDVPGADAGRLVRRRRRALHGRPVRVVLVHRGQLEAVEGLTAAPDPHGRVGQRARPVFTGDDHGGRAVGDRRAHEQAQRARDHARAEHLVEGGALVEVSVRVLRRVGVVLHTDERELLFGRAVGGHVALRGQREARWRREGEGRLPLAVYAGAQVEAGLVAARLVQLLDAEDHDEVGEPGRDEGVGVADADRAGGAHVLGARAQRRRPDAERLRRHRRNMAREGRSLRHHGYDHEYFDVLWYLLR